MKKIDGRRWYAYQKNEEDTDCGTGTFNRKEAIKWLKNQIKEGNAEARICLCSENSDFCEGLITKEDL